MFKYKMLDILFEFAESLELKDHCREQFAVEFFRYSLTHEMLDMTILIQYHYEVYLFKQTDNCIEAIISAFNKSSLNARLKTYVLNEFIEVLKYEQVERLLNCMENFITCDKAHSYLVTNVNPMLTAVKIINILFKMSSRYPVSEFRATTLMEIVTEQSR